MDRVLVTYFSAGGVTKKVAEELARVLDADVFEIVPEIPYTKADLRWINPRSRSSVEMKDRSSRPKIASVIDDISKYDHIFVGFPVWWYREPSIIDTFMESYDFSGKTVIPFCTSGSSGIGESGSNMQALSEGAKVLQGMRFKKNVSGDELKAWADSVI